MSVATERRTTIDVDGLKLEGVVHAGGDALGAVVLHPHPLYGGDMRNHVVSGICDAVSARGGTALRFNFRGADGSEGRYDDGRGEASDARAALREVRALVPGAPVVMAGYSFGAMVASSIAATEEIAGLVLISPPVAHGSLAPLPEGLPVLIVTGERDAISPSEAVRAMESPSVRVMVVPGADHGWWPGLDALMSEVDGFLHELSNGSREQRNPA